MKKKLSIAILMLFMIPNFVLAAGKASGSAPTSVENGSRVTFSVNISNTAAWNIKLSGSGATSGCSQRFADVTANGKNTTKKLSITCKATSIGTITFKATGDITSADGTNSNVSITKTSFINFFETISFQFSTSKILLKSVIEYISRISFLLVI